MNSPMNIYLWREQPNLMPVLRLVILGLLAVWSVIRLGGHFGLLSADLVDTALMVVGVPFLVAAVAEIWLVFKAARRYLRARQLGGRLGGPKRRTRYALGVACSEAMLRAMSPSCGAWPRMVEGSL